MRLVKQIHEWLRPSSSACPLCGQDTARSGGHSKTGSTPIPLHHPHPRAILGSLCRTCLRKIPWIIRIACPTCGRPDPCGDCLRSAHPPYMRCRCAVRYDDSMKEMLATYKYRGAERLEPVLAAILAASLERLGREEQALEPASFFHRITAVPLSLERMQQRGFNQAEKLARRLSSWYGVPYTEMLVRRVHTDKQSQKSRRGRVQDLKGIFEPLQTSMLEPSEPQRPMNILLVDDVYTTGSTMRECASALAAGNPSIRIYGALWARSGGGLINDVHSADI